MSAASVFVLTRMAIRASDPPAPPSPPAVSTAAEAARRGVVKVTGIARSCRKVIEGSGFVYAPGHVMTAAHVVAGVDHRQRIIDDRSKVHDAKVVLFDPERDVAVLHVPTLRAQPLRFAEAGRNVPAVIAGHPHGADFSATPATITATQNASGRDLYETTDVVREVHTIRGEVQQGGSGSALLSAGGRVYGMVFASASDQAGVGYALTSSEIAPQARAGARLTEAVDTRDCD
ncbi:hypothetical protein Ppa06_15430 [Planomonospora parontospora subsp. parontospora]|uniref:Serine protease n=2 Tax=Planomonospora parontospora TaxID=58119 RepID=A0AA37F3E3_9ACTN|nr:trypsin-like peptidase domain-containing protein [Planomonospora parontospora]GGK57217.1 hypothetical protein GCM10010126_15980 [Planomonospora parontospora]GII07745.1 hypothetical protein Ppa06_15430 [Planomonospora parontospora subsp. parontospora]